VSLSQDRLRLLVDPHFLGAEGVLKKMQSPDLKHLTADGLLSMEDFDFSPLSSHERFESVNLRSMSLKHIDTLLRHVRRLSILHVRSCQITDSAIRSISAIDGLE
jgi:hypothetical protein